MSRSPGARGLRSDKVPYEESDSGEPRQAHRRPALRLRDRVGTLAPRHPRVKVSESPLREVFISIFASHVTQGQSRRIIQEDMVLSADLFVRQSRESQQRYCAAQLALC